MNGEFMLASHDLSKNESKQDSSMSFAFIQELFHERDLTSNVRAAFFVGDRFQLIRMGHCTETGAYCEGFRAGYFSCFHFLGHCAECARDI